MTTEIFQREADGNVSWVHMAGDTYLATGVDCHGRRFRKSGPWAFVRGINIWNGTCWLVRHGRRHRIMQVRNW